MVFLILYTFFFLPARIVIGFGGGEKDASYFAVSFRFANLITLQPLCSYRSLQVATRAQPIGATPGL
jgi:hypothetical protein